MMRPVPHPLATRRFGPPMDWNKENHGECGTLEVADLKTASGPYMESLWRPDADDLKTLNEGGSIALGIRGDRLPVLYLGVASGPKHDGTPKKADNPLAIPLIAAVHTLRLVEQAGMSTEFLQSLVKGSADAGAEALRNIGLLANANEGEAP